MIPKFRAYDEETETMFDVLGFDLDDNEIWSYDQSYELNQCKIMQSTGLKDKNCLEVYFNDVVEDEYGHRYEVVLEGDCLRCNGIRKIRGGHKPKNRWFGIDLEIIGNRFENPKLLEKEE